MEKKEEQKWLWILLISLWWCSEARLEHRSSECFSEKTWIEIILNLLLQTPLHPSLSVITTCSLISLQAIRTKIAKAIFFFSFWPDFDTSSFETLLMLSSPFHSFLLCPISFKDPHNFLISYLIPSDMIPDALTPLQVLPNLSWQLRQEVAPIVPVICKILQCLGITSGQAEKMSHIA